MVKTTLVKEYKKQQTKPNVNHPIRNPLPDRLRREVITLQPKEDASNLKQIGKEITDRWEYQPEEHYVKQFVLPEYIQAIRRWLNGKACDSAASRHAFG